MTESINHVSKEIARQLNEDEALVKQVNMFFWKETRQQISSGEHTTVWLRGLGTMTVSRHKLREHIKRLIAHIRFFRRPESIVKNRKQSRQDILDIKIQELRLMLKRRNDIAIQYKNNTDKANIKKNAKLSKTNLGQQAPDPTGIGKQALQSEEYKTTG